MIIAEYTLDHPILRRALAAVPDIEVTWEDTYSTADGRGRFVAWVDCADFDAFDSAIRDDPTVERPEVLTEVGGQRLYRFDLVGEGAETSITPVLAEVGGVHRRLSATNEGWRNRTRFPDRDALERLFRFCRDHDVPFTFHNLYEQAEWRRADAPSLTDVQHRTLVEAVDSGYLDIPRGCSLAELGERLGVSESAASERFRRAVKKLVTETIYE